MRDGQIYKMQESEQQRFVILYRQVNFLNMRVEAYESVLVSRWAMIRAILNPLWLKRQVDAAQLAMLQEHDAAMREKTQKAKEEAAKPKIISPFTLKPVAVALLALGLASGCVSTRTHRKALENEKALCTATQGAQAKESQKVIRAMENEIAAKNKRLKKFNQIDEAGRLRPLQKEEGLPIGDEEWMK